MTGPAEPAEPEGQPAGWTEDDEAFVQAVIANNRVDLGVIADVIEQSGADSLTILRFEPPAGES